MNYINKLFVVIIAFCFVLLSASAALLRGDAKTKRIPAGTGGCSSAP